MERDPAIAAARLNFAVSMIAVERNGAARGIRTPDPVITNDVLYRLSYCGPIILRMIFSENRCPLFRIMRAL
jgi:hypothetical protein